MEKGVVAVLAAISVVGMLSIPLGDPKFLGVAIVLEASYIALTVLSIKKIRYALIPNMIIAGIVIAGNTFSSTHADVMLTLNPIQNAVVLIIGGYVLQSLLIVTSVLAYKRLKRQLVMR
ncbi:MAG: hypothetical protein ACE5JV_01955 [Nitrososphaerales archaeon]